MTATQETTQISTRDSWLFDNRISITIPEGLSSKDIFERLTKNRQRLEILKLEYRDAKKDSPEAAALFIEIIRVAKAIDSMKDRLVIDGAEFKTDEKDIEHPDAARKRLSGFWQSLWEG